VEPQDTLANPPSMPPAPAAVDPKTERTLPFGLIVVVLLQLAAAAWILTGAAGLRPLEGTTIFADLFRSSQAVAVLFAVVGGVQAVAALLLLTRNRLAWLVIMLIMGASLVTGITSYFVGDPGPVRLFLYVVSAFYLNQRPVRAAFGIRYGRPREETVS
jgi:hypothetical protein